MARPARAAPRGARAVELFLDEERAATREGRYRHAVAAAEKAVQAAEELDDPALLVRALAAEAGALRMLGDRPAALTRCTRVLALAQDSSIGGRLGGRSAAWAVAQSHMDWVASARFLTEIRTRELLGVLDAADRWLTATGHRDWRAGILLQRAGVHSLLGERDAAIAVAEEALAAYRPDAPGYTLAAHHSNLGDLLRLAGRDREARSHFQAVLDDPGSSDRDHALAYTGLARCALDAEDAEAGRQYATTAVRLAEGHGDETLCARLEALAEACRATGDLDAAWLAATRHLDAARRIGGHLRLHYGTRDAVDVALDRGDLATARELLVELDRHAAAMDRATDGTMYSAEAGRRHRRLAELDGRPDRA